MVTCPACKRSYEEGLLSECTICHEHFCGLIGCPTSCRCTKIVEIRPSIPVTKAAVMVYHAENLVFSLRCIGKIVCSDVVLLLRKISIPAALFMLCLTPTINSLYLRAFRRGARYTVVAPLRGGRRAHGKSQPCAAWSDDCGHSCSSRWPSAYIQPLVPSLLQRFVFSLRWGEATA